MFDSSIRRIIDPHLDRIGAILAGHGCTANSISLAGLGLGLGAAALIAVGEPFLALLPLLASRFADGLDGAVARASRLTDFGGLLDVTADFCFYGAIPFGFNLLNPDANAVAG